MVVDAGRPYTPGDMTTGCSAHPPHRTVISPGFLLILCSTLLFALMNVGVKAIAAVPVHEIVFVRALTTLVLGYLLLRLKHIRV